MRRQSLSDTSGADAATTAAAAAAAEAEAAAALGPQNGEEVVLVYRHAEGFTNAVRRPVKMTDMLNGRAPVLRSDRPAQTWESRRNSSTQECPE